MRKGVSLKHKLKLFLSNYKKLHEAAITHHEEEVGRTALDIIAGSRTLSEWDKSHYFGDTAIFSPHLSVAEDSWRRIEEGEISEESKLDRARFVASFSKHEPVALDALAYIERSELDERGKVEHARYVGAHTQHLSVAKRTLNFILRSGLRDEEKIKYVRELAQLSKHKAIRSKASEWLGSYRIRRG
ncbi:MAG: hypothetical protein QXF56_00010 [Candidatus Micrarchaeia archaeon]